MVFHCTPQTLIKYIFSNIPWNLWTETLSLMIIYRIIVLYLKGCKFYSYLQDPWLFKKKSRLRKTTESSIFARALRVWVHGESHLCVQLNYPCHKMTMKSAITVIENCQTSKRKIFPLTNLVHIKHWLVIYYLPHLSHLNNGFPNSYLCLLIQFIREECMMTIFKMFKSYLASPNKE